MERFQIFPAQRAPRPRPPIFHRPGRRTCAVFPLSCFQQCGCCGTGRSAGGGDHSGQAPGEPLSDSGDSTACTGMRDRLTELSAVSARCCWERHKANNGPAMGGRGEGCVLGVYEPFIVRGGQCAGSCVSSIRALSSTIHDTE